MDAIHEVGVSRGRLGETQGVKALRDTIDDLTIRQIGAAVFDQGDLPGSPDDEAQANGSVEIRVALHAITVAAREQREPRLDDVIDLGEIELSRRALLELDAAVAAVGANA